jgi:dTDP-4-amino-4,6-dideoxygalactose transaminase
VRTIPFCDIGASYAELKPRIDAALARCLRSGQYVGGTEVQAFEAAFAQYCGVDHCVGVANGLDALRLALLAMGIGSGDEVIVPSNTYIATWLAVSQCGATPVPVEPEPNTFNLDPDRVAAAITGRTKAIMPVHLCGLPADMDPLLRIARTNGLLVLEDAAQAHGACYGGRRIGGHGDAAAWSFYPTKNLGAFGDAGAVTTNNHEIAERLRMLGNYGSKVRGEHEDQGYNSRLDPLQAAALAVKLDHLDEWNDRRAKIAAAYNTEFAPTSLTVPWVPCWAKPVWHLYVVRHEQRDSLRKLLEEAGVNTLVHYPIPPHLQRAYSAAGFHPGQFPLAERLAAQSLSLPMWPQMTAEQVDYTVSAVLRCLDEIC